MPTVSIVLGSTSDEAVMLKVAKQLDLFDVTYEVKVISAHRLPDDLKEYTEKLEKTEYKVVIAIAGMSAALPGVLAAHTLLPVIGVPVQAKSLAGQDSLYSIVQMPKGVPVACVAVNGGENAALLAIRILATHDEILSLKLLDWQLNMQKEARKKVDTYANQMNLKYGRRRGVGHPN